MSTFIALLLIAIAWSLVLVAMNRHDGLGRVAGRRTPPRSHVPDDFERALHV